VERYVRILFTCHGAYGHFHPIAPMALAAQAKGHDVLVATGPELVDWVAACGLRAVPAGLSSIEVSERLAALSVEDPVLAMFHRFSTIAVPPTLADLLQLTESWRPDVVVHEEGEYAAPLLAALLQISCVTQSWAAPVRPEKERQLYRTLLAPIWAAQGVSGEPRTSGATYLDSCPPAYQSDEIDSVPGVVAARPLLFDGPPAPAPPWLATLPRPSAYVTFGTVPVFSRPEILRSAIDAIEPLVSAMVVTTGPNPPDAVGITSPRVHVVDYLAQSQILPNVDLVVSHGGAGTTAGALAHGLPHLVMPGRAQSQQRNAMRTETIGLGLFVREDAGTEQVRAAARRLLSDPSYRAAGAVARTGLERMPSLDQSVRLVERLGGG
jgi:UDP:flavonoid glycosyltransferase YjiC (YdhE family)